MEEAYEKVPGVIRAVSGYIGGTVEKPTYEQVSTKATGHAEAVQVTYDPTKVSYPQLVDWFWRNIDPVDAKGQFCDKGSPYSRRSSTTTRRRRRSPRRPSRRSRRRALQGADRHRDPARDGPSGRPRTITRTTTRRIRTGTPYYKTACGRAQRLEQIWGPPKPPQTLTSRG